MLRDNRSLTLIKALKLNTMDRTSQCHKSYQLNGGLQPYSESDILCKVQVASLWIRAWIRIKPSKEEKSYTCEVSPWLCSRANKIVLLRRPTKSISQTNTSQKSYLTSKRLINHLISPCMMSQFWRLLQVKFTTRISLVNSNRQNMWHREHLTCKTYCTELRN